MNNLGKQLLKMGNFPIEREKNLEKVLDQLKHGKMGLSISSFDAIYDLTPEGDPFPIGCINFDDGKKRFVISWREEFSKIGVENIEEYKIKIRNYPTADYPVLSLMVGIHNGKVDPESKQDLWYYGEYYLDISNLHNRIKLYQLLNCDEILFCLFDGDVESLDSFGFSLNVDELKTLSNEILSLLSLMEDKNLDNHISAFSEATTVVANCFNKQGLPKSQDALQVYLNRKQLDPKPENHNWGEFLSI